MGIEDCIVKISKEDKDTLIRNIENISSILNKYPNSAIPQSYYYTGMTRTKNYASKLNEWIRILSVEGE